MWVGPETEKDIHNHFMSFFGKATVLDADCICRLDTPENIAATLRHYANCRGIFSDPAEVPFKRLFTPCMNERIEQAMSADSDSGLGGALVVDVSQSAHRFRQCAWLPTLTKSSQLVSLSKQHIFTPQDGSGAQPE